MSNRDGPEVTRTTFGGVALRENAVTLTEEPRS
jgi:hypothetical protein